MSGYIYSENYLKGAAFIVNGTVYYWYHPHTHVCRLLFLCT